MDLAAAFAELEEILERVWEAAGERLPGGVPPHRVRFSKRLVASWAVIYYRRREVRLSPYVFLLPETKLPHGSDFRELAATVLHEAVHAHVWRETGDPGHPPTFAERLARLGVAPNGHADLGPTNVAWRHRYACPGCGRGVLRRRRLPGPSSCSACHPGGYDARFRLEHREVLESPFRRVGERGARVLAAVEEGKRALLRGPASPPLAR